MTLFRNHFILFLVTIALFALHGITMAQTEITFMFRGGDLQEQLVHHWIEEFENDNPDIKVTWQIAAGDWRDQMPLWIATGMAPDVFETWGRGAKDWAEQGLLLDLSPFVERDLTQEDIDDFFPSSYEAGILSWGPMKGLHFGIPTYSNVFPFYYNKTLFEEAGIAMLDDLDRQGAWTWDTLVDIGKKLTKHDGNSIVQYGLADDSILHPTARGSGWIYAAGGRVFDFPDNPTRFLMDDPKTILALEFLQDLIWEHEIVPPMDIRSQFDFRDGLSAMHIGLGTGWLERMNLRVEDQFDWDLGPRPMGPEDRGYYIASDMVAISATTEQAEAAWKFVQYITSQRGMQAHMEIMGRGPARRSVYPDYAERFPDRSTIYHLEGVQTGHISPETLMYKVGEARPLIWQAVRDNIAPNLKRPAQAIAEIADAVRALYEE